MACIAAIGSASHSVGCPVDVKRDRPVFGFINHVPQHRPHLGRPAQRSCPLVGDQGFGEHRREMLDAGGDRQASQRRQASLAARDEHAGGPFVSARGVAHFLQPLVERVVFAIVGDLLANESLDCDCSSGSMIWSADRGTARPKKLSPMGNSSTSMKRGLPEACSRREVTDDLNYKVFAPLRRHHSMRRIVSGLEVVSSALRPPHLHPDFVERG